MRHPLPLADRFRAHAVPGPDCWGWRGNKNQAGYGQFRVGRRGRVWSAHRIAWILAHGDIPSGMMVLHKCDNPSCCNVDHLYLGTAKDNARDCIERGRRAKTNATHSRIRKLTDDQVRGIRDDTRPAHEVANQYMVSEGTVYAIRSGRRKQNVK